MASFGFNYDTLKTAIHSFTEDDSAEFVAVIDNIIGLAETRIYREADLDVFRKYATSTLTDGDRYINKPTDFVIDRYAYITVAGTAATLQRKDVSFMHELWPTFATEGVPQFYADWDYNTFVVAPTPSANITITLAYTFRPDRIDSVTTTTWLSTHAPDLLLYASLAEAAVFLKSVPQGQEPGLLNVWEGKYQSALQRVRDEEMRRQRVSEFRTGESIGEV